MTSTPSGSPTPSTPVTSASPQSTTSAASADQSHAPGGIDVRAPRFSASITSVLLLVTVISGLSDPTLGGAETVAERALGLSTVLLAIVVLTFIWGVLSPRTHPYALLFRAVVAPALGPVREREDPRPPRFAQGVGLVVTGAGLILALLGVPYAIPVAAAAAFVAAALNATVGFCLGCQLYVLLVRAGLVRQSPRAV